jgi:hypothetical protein
VSWAAGSAASSLAGVTDVPAPTVVNRRNVRMTVSSAPADDGPVEPFSPGTLVAAVERALGDTSPAA